MTKMRISKEYELKSIGKHFVVARAGQSDSIVFAVNETGAFLWRGIEEGLSKEELCRRLCVEYEAEPSEEAQIEGDVEEFLTQLKTLGVLEESGRS